MDGKIEKNWILNKMANGHWSCDNYDLVSDDIEQVEKILQPQFASLMAKEHIMIGYDNWSGVFIMQSPGVQTDCSDDLIMEIYVFLNKQN